MKENMMRSPVHKMAGLAGAIGLTTILTLAATSSQAQRPFPTLLGVRVWESTWKDVLRRYGQPTRVEVGASAGTSATPAQGGTASAPGAGGMSMPGGMGLPGLPGMGPGGARGPYGGGSPYGMAGGGGSPYGMGGQGSPYGMARGMGGKMGAGMGGAMGQDTEMGGGGPPSGFGLPGMGSPGGMSMPGMGGGPMGGDGEQALSPEDEVTWVYERGNKKSPNVDLFLFNRTGRLIQIQSFGYEHGAVTSKGVRLGDPVVKIFHDYGWTGNMTKDAAAGTMVLDYGKEHGIAFQLLDRHNGLGFRVVGITAALTNPKDIPGNRTDEEAK